MGDGYLLVKEGMLLSDCINLHQCQCFIWYVGGGTAYHDTGNNECDVGEGETITTVGA